jgi:hypothetical protein
MLRDTSLQVFSPSSIKRDYLTAEGRAGKAGKRSDRGKRTGGYSSSTNSSTGTPYALAIFVTVGM